MSSIMYLFINPRANFSLQFNAAARFKAIFTIVRRNFVLIFLTVILSILMLAFLAPFESISGVSFTDEEREIYGIGDGDVIPVPTVPVGGLWDVLWTIRGQRPGMYDGTGERGIPFFTVSGLSGTLNGPTNLIGVPFEGITDLVVYLPLFLSPVFVVAHWDLVPFFFIKIIITMLLAAATVGLLILIGVPLLMVIAFFTPLLLMRLWVISGPLLRLGLGVGILLLIVAAFAAVIGL